MSVSACGVVALAPGEPEHRQVEDEVVRGAAEPDTPSCRVGCSPALPDAAHFPGWGSALAVTYVVTASRLLWRLETTRATAWMTTPVASKWRIASG